MTRSAIAAIAILFSAPVASAQEAPAPGAQGFNGNCQSYKGAGKDSCVATQWCRWVDRKPVQLPNGQQFTPTGYCAFKPGHRQGFEQAANQSKQPQ